MTFWTCWSAYWVCAGWLLSAIHQLNAAGYAGALILALVALALWRKRASAAFYPKIYWPKVWRRFRRPFPALFLFIAVLAFIGGAIYPPNNYDALTYRLPRMLHWLAAGHWHWIQTPNLRMNYSAAASEWVAMPWFVLLHSDRGLFFISIVEYLLLPGLLFSVFRRLGVAGKVAWVWMWLFPLAYGYAMQAGSIGNDLMGVLFALAALAFGLRARDTRKVQDIWLTGLAVALMTGAKLSNLPIVLPCLIAVWPALIRLRERWMATFAMAIVILTASGVPTMVLNQIYSGSWTGDPANVNQFQATDKSAALLGNSILLVEQSLMPPVLPAAGKINDFLDKEMPAFMQRKLQEKFPRYYLSPLKELPQEEISALGLGVTVVLLAGVGMTVFGFKRMRSGAELPLPIVLIPFAGWFGLLVFMLETTTDGPTRLMLPYFPLAVVPALWLSAQERLLRLRTGKVLAGLAALSVLPAMILTPARPLFPAQKVIGWLARHHPESAGVQRMAVVYSTYAHRNDALAPLRAAVPAGVKRIGFVGGSNDTAYSLWRPFGQREVVELRNRAGQPPQVPDGIKWIVVKKDVWSALSPVPLQEWATQHHAQIVSSVSLEVLVHWGPETWYLVHIQ